MSLLAGTGSAPARDDRPGRTPPVRPARRTDDPHGRRRPRRRSPSPRARSGARRGDRPADRGQRGHRDRLRGGPPGSQDLCATNGFGMHQVPSPGDRCAHVLIGFGQVGDRHRRSIPDQSRAGIAQGDVSEQDRLGERAGVVEVGDRLALLPDRVQPVLFMSAAAAGNARQRFRRALRERGHRRLRNEPGAFSVGFAPHLPLVAEEDGARLWQLPFRLEVLGAFRQESAVVPVQLHRWHVAAPGRTGG